MRKALLLTVVSAFLLSQVSCGALMHQANRAKHILQWPFRAELDSRFFDTAPEVERDLVAPRFA